MKRGPETVLSTASMNMEMELPKFCMSAIMGSDNSESAQVPYLGG